MSSPDPLKWMGGDEEDKGTYRPYLLMIRCAKAESLPPVRLVGEDGGRVLSMRTLARLRSRPRRGYWVPIGGWTHALALHARQKIVPSCGARILALPTATDKDRGGLHLEHRKARSTFNACACKASTPEWPAYRYSYEEPYQLSTRRLGSLKVKNLAMISNLAILCSQHDFRCTNIFTK